MYVPAGFTVEQHEATSTAWNAITALVELANKALTVRILGTDSTTDKESSHASTTGGMQLLYTKFRTDADAESAFWHDGPLQYWYLLNFRGTRKLQDRRVLDLVPDEKTGEYRLLDEGSRRQPSTRLRMLSDQIRAGDEVPWPVRDATPPQDMAAVAETQGKAAAALVQLTTAATASPEFSAAIARIDVPRYLERYFPMLQQDESGIQLSLSEVSDFPRKGDDKAVSLRNSNYSVFDPDYADSLKADWPEIWALGGSAGKENSGDSQYATLRPVIAGGGDPETDEEEQSIRVREAWAARHADNYRLAGVVALIKWFVVGSIGEAKMKTLINERKDFVKAQRQKEMQDAPRNVRAHLHDGLAFADETVDAMSQATPDVMGDITGQVLKVLSDARDYTDARQRLQAAFPSLDRARLRDMLTGGLLIAQAAGMETVQREVEKR
jgi:hypothetical protein